MDIIPILMFPALFLLIFTGLPVAFSLIIVAVIGAFTVFGDLAILQLYGAVLSTSSNFILAAIPLFVFMGAILERTGIALRLFQGLQLWVGGAPGGLAIATALKRAALTPDQVEHFHVFEGEQSESRIHDRSSR